MTPHSPTAAGVLAAGTPSPFTVSYVPLPDSVAQLDTSTPEWVLYLDTDSPAIDHCWAMSDVLRILSTGLDSAESAVAVKRLRLIQN